MYTIVPNYKADCISYAVLKHDLNQIRMLMQIDNFVFSESLCSYFDCSFAQDMSSEPHSNDVDRDLDHTLGLVK